MKLKIGLLALALSLTLVGCSDEENNKPKIENKNEIQNEIDSSSDKKEEELDNKDEIKKDDIENSDKNKIEEISKIEEESKEKEVNKESSNEELKLKIYTADVEDTSKIIEFETVTISKDSSIEYKLNELINIMKKDYFKDDVRIVLESIDANNIATINLIDQEKWSKHFQGSTGGVISQSTIVETLLQREYKGEWIKGLKILVDGKDEEVFDHAVFTEVFYR